MIIKVPQLPVGPVGNGIGIFTRGQEVIAPADVNPDTVGFIFGMPGFRISIALDLFYFKIDSESIAAFVLVPRLILFPSACTVMVSVTRMTAFSKMVISLW
jgi:hypothetical protein